MMHKHLFALYEEDISSFKELDVVSLQDVAVLHRIKNILRLVPGEYVVLFDRRYHILCRIEAIDKRNVMCVVEKYEKNIVLHPHITVALPILKKEAFEQALYSCVEVGASEIIPFSSQKTHGSISEHDKKRAQKIIIAAAEQSKYFAFPELALETTFEEIVATAQGEKIFFDAQGKPAREMINNLDHTDGFTLIIGPEGDLTGEEKKFLVSAEFLFCALTPTILRAHQALTIGLGLIRSLW